MTTKTTIEFENGYNSRKIKSEFFREISGESKTNQDHLAQASISIMAEKFGIDAIINKAKANEPSQYTQQQLFGVNLCNFISDNANLLNLKRDLSKVFEQVPAKIRKELFNDDVKEFVHSYSEGNINKLRELEKYGLVNGLQVDKLEQHYKDIENQKKIEFESKVNEALNIKLKELNLNIGESTNE